MKHVSAACAVFETPEWRRFTEKTEDLRRQAKRARKAFEKSSRAKRDFERRAKVLAQEAEEHNAEQHALNGNTTEHLGGQGPGLGPVFERMGLCPVPGSGGCGIPPPKLAQPTPLAEGPMRQERREKTRRDKAAQKLAHATGEVDGKTFTISGGAGAAPAIKAELANLAGQQAAAQDAGREKEAAQKRAEHVAAFNAEVKAMNGAFSEPPKRSCWSATFPTLLGPNLACGGPEESWLWFTIGTSYAVATRLEESENPEGPRHDHVLDADAEAPERADGRLPFLRQGPSTTHTLRPISYLVCTYERDLSGDAAVLKSSVVVTFSSWLWALVMHHASSTTFTMAPALDRVDTVIRNDRRVESGFMEPAYAKDEPQLRWLLASLMVSHVLIASGNTTFMPFIDRVFSGVATKVNGAAGVVAESFKAAEIPLKAQRAGLKMKGWVSGLKLPQGFQPARTANPSIPYAAADNDQPHLAAVASIACRVAPATPPKAPGIAYRYDETTRAFLRHLDAARDDHAEWAQLRDSIEVPASLSGQDKEEFLKCTARVCDAFEHGPSALQAYITEHRALIFKAFAKAEVYDESEDAKKKSQRIIQCPDIPARALFAVFGKVMNHAILVAGEAAGGRAFHIKGKSLAEREAALQSLAASATLKANADTSAFESTIGREERLHIELLIMLHFCDSRECVDLVMRMLANGTQLTMGEALFLGLVMRNSGEGQTASANFWVSAVRLAIVLQDFYRLSVEESVAYVLEHALIEGDDVSVELMEASDSDAAPINARFQALYAQFGASVTGEVKPEVDFLRTLTGDANERPLLNCVKRVHGAFFTQDSRARDSGHVAEALAYAKGTSLFQASQTALKAVGGLFMLAYEHAGPSAVAMAKRKSTAIGALFSEAAEKGREALSPEALAMKAADVKAAVDALRPSDLELPGVEAMMANFRKLQAYMPTTDAAAQALREARFATESCITIWHETSDARAEWVVNASKLAFLYGAQKPADTLTELCTGAVKWLVGILGFMAVTIISACLSVPGGWAMLPLLLFGAALVAALTLALVYRLTLGRLTTTAQLTILGILGALVGLVVWRWKRGTKEGTTAAIKLARTKFSHASGTLRQGLRAALDYVTRTKGEEKWIRTLRAIEKLDDAETLMVYLAACTQVAPRMTNLFLWEDPEFKTHSTQAIIARYTADAEFALRADTLVDLGIESGFRTCPLLTRIRVHCSQSVDPEILREEASLQRRFFPRTSAH